MLHIANGCLLCPLCRNPQKLHRVARTPLKISFDTLEHSIFQICSDRGVEGKQANEVYHSWDALRIWKDRFESRFGTLLECIHHSNPDDPPDVNFIFEHGQLNVEHTRLEPSHFGWARALHEENCPDQFIKLPSISHQPKNQEDMLSIMLERGGGWSEFQSEMNDWFRFLISLIHKKIQHRSSGILVVEDVSLTFEFQLRPLAEATHAHLSARPDEIRDWTILLHSRSNGRRYLSYLITAGEKIQSRSNIDIEQRVLDEAAGSNDLQAPHRNESNA